MISKVDLKFSEAFLKKASTDDLYLKLMVIYQIFFLGILMSCETKRSNSRDDDDSIMTI